MAGEYEYPSPKKLSGISRYFIKIPESIIYDNESGDKLVTTFSFFSVSKGLDDRSMFSLNGVVEWSGKKPDRHSYGVNSKFKKSIERLEQNGYIYLNGEISNTRCCVANVNMEKIHEECDDYNFAVIYVDELEKILDWNNSNSRDAFINNDVLLRVFAYLRMLIKRRPNKLAKDDNDVDKRKLRWPESWNGYYADMSEELGISARIMSDLVNVLCDIGLLYTESLPRIKVNEKWKTSHTLFCNTYKREGQYLLASGEEYYKIEIKNKKKILNID